MDNSLLISIFHICLFFLSFSNCAFGSQNFHVVDVNALSASDVCFAPKDMERPKSAKPSLKVVDRHGPCSTLHPVEKWTPAKILSQDPFRVESIHRRTSAVSSEDKTQDPSTSSEIAAGYGGSYGVGNYIVSVGIGTPSKTMTLVFDTGSEVTWVQCEPCRPSCHPQKDPIFDPAQSSTFMNVSCNSTPCNSLGYGCLGSSCLYDVGYGDGSYTFGYYSEDTLTLKPDVIQDFRFGCGQNNSVLFGEIAGLLGLGPFPESFVLQTSNKYHSVFAYCLPASSSSTGYLNFGRNNGMQSTSRTPIPQHPNPLYYYISMTSITVAGETLQISPTVFSNAGMIIDSGTVITRLPPDAYQALKSAFKEHMTQYKMVSGVDPLLDTCYDFTGYDNVTIPSVGVQFSNNVSLDLDPSGIWYPVSNSQGCLAFAGNSGPTDLAIFGNVQQRTFYVEYDIPNQQIGFSPEGEQMQKALLAI